MSKVNAEQLEGALRGSLKLVYLVCGDEPLLQQEAADSIRRTAKNKGFLEKEIFHADAQFNWHDLLQSANSMSLFNDKKCLEVRLNNYKIGDAGNKALQAYCEHPSDDNLLLIIGPKADRAAQNSKWFKAVEALGTVVTVWPVHRTKMPHWVAQRLQQRSLKADSQAIDILVEKVEGNLLAAVQEIEKLALLAPDGVIDGKLMASAVVDSARYDVFSLIDKALSGDARGAASTLNGLKAEGIEIPVVLWALSRELRTLVNLKFAQSKGRSIQSVARQNGVFDNRIPLLKSALARLPFAALRMLVKECALADRCLKGMSKNNAWDVVLDVVLVLSGTRSLSAKSVQALIR